MNTIIAYSLIFIFLVILSGIFVASEFSLTSVEPSDFAIDKESSLNVQRKKISLLNKAYANVTFTLSSIQLGITITTLLCGIVAPIIFSTPIRKFLLYVGFITGEETSTFVKILAGITASTICMIFGELLPKNYAIARPIKTVEQTVGITLLFSRLFRYFIRFYDSAAQKILNTCGVQFAEQVVYARSPQELSALVLNSAAQGNFDTKLSKLVDRSLRFGQRSAEELMTPRAKVETLESSATINELIALSINTGFSRFPVIDGDFDETLGTIHIKQVLSIPVDQRATFRVGQFTRSVIKIPASLTGDEVMAALRTSNSRIAIVVDEYGGNAGIVTYEDLIEEIVGEVHDEYDHGTRVLRLGANYKVSGLLRLDEVAEETGLIPPEGDYETLGGLIMFLLGRIPTVGDCLTISNRASSDHNDQQKLLFPLWKASVEKMDRFRVDEVLLTPISYDSADYSQLLASVNASDSYKIFPERK